MLPNFQSLINKIIPYDTNTIISQLYQYNCFETQVNRAVVFGDVQNLKSICLINAYWFNHWKKVSCYHEMEKEISLAMQNNNMNYLSNCLNTAFQNLYSTEKFEPLEPNIENKDLMAECGLGTQQFCVDWESEFDIISSELWNLFAPVGNMNQNTNINLNLEMLSIDSRMVNISDKACYVIFWNTEKNKLGKFILKFDDNQKKNIFVDSMKANSFRQFYKEKLSKILEGSDAIVHYCDEVSIKCLNKTDIDLPRKNPYKSPCGLTNIHLTCYMNSALQSLFNIKKLTNYLLELSHTIMTSYSTAPLLKAYTTTILNLSRKAEGSKKKTVYAPHEFFNSIKNESEFRELAGDSYDVVRHFFQKMHEQLMPIKNESNSIFTKYILNGPNKMMTAMDVQNLNSAINNYSALNKTKIANLFYFMERSITKCSNCNYSTSNFNVQMSVIFALEDIRQWKYRNLLLNMWNQNNNNNNNNNNFNNMGMNNMNMMNSNMMINNNMNNNNMVGNNMGNNNNMMSNNDMQNNNMVNNNNNNTNMNQNNNMNMNINNNMNNNMNMNNNIMINNNGTPNNNMMMNNMNMNNNNGGRNLNGGMFPSPMNPMQNPMGGQMPNPMSGPMQNPMPGPMQNPMGGQMQNQMNFNMMMNNNEMMIYNIKNMNFDMLANCFINIPQPTSVTLQDGFEHYRKDNLLSGQNNLYCQNCNQSCPHIQSNHFYTLPEYLVLNFNRGTGNMYKVGITFPEMIDLTGEVQTNLDSYKYRLISIVTHLGPHGTGGHYIAFCYLEDKNLWYKFDDSLVTLTTFNEASKFGDTYILFYHRM